LFSIVFDYLFCVKSDRHSPAKFPDIHIIGALIRPVDHALNQIIILNVVPQSSHSDKG
jgi:uncharacterized membrane protein YagU involved in acid resistance